MDFENAVAIADRFIAAQETFSPAAYWDANGYAIGYGNHYYENGLPVSPGDTITADRAAQLLDYYVRQNMQALVNQITAELTDNQLAALTSLRYNCGTITMTVLGMINQGADPETIADKIRQTCTTSNGAVLDVLLQRRDLEANLFTAGNAALSVGLVLFLGVGAWFLLRGGKF